MVEVNGKLMSRYAAKCARRAADALSERQGASSMSMSVECRADEGGAGERDSLSRLYELVTTAISSVDHAVAIAREIRDSASGVSVGEANAAHLILVSARGKVQKSRKHVMRLIQRM